MATASALQLFPPGLRLGVGLGRDSVRLRVRVLLPVLQRVIHAVPIREDAGPSPCRLGGPHGLRHGAEVALTRLRAHAGCLELQAKHEAIGGSSGPPSSATLRATLRRGIRRGGHHAPPPLKVA